MPYRKVVLTRGEIYHVFNRSLDRVEIFRGNRLSKNVISRLKYGIYAGKKPTFSRYMSLSVSDKNELIENLWFDPRRVRVYAYCLMPNHFHLLLEQVTDFGIRAYIQEIQSGFSHYYNLKNNRKGPLFEGRFKAVRIETYEQLLHVSRYIHLNPLTNCVVSDLEMLKTYPWSSLREYLGLSKGFCEVERLLKQFREPDEYLKFLTDHADYQKELKRIKHLLGV